MSGLAMEIVYDEINFHAANTHTHTHTHIYIEREIERERERQRERKHTHTFKTVYLGYTVGGLY